nr:uncharacterized protein LOC113692427 isoform X2 [Coffea arabica]
MRLKALLQESNGGKLKRGTIRNIASLFKTSVRTVQRIWKLAAITSTDGRVDVSRRFSKRCGRKRVDIDFTLIMAIPLRRRTNIRSLSSEMKVSKSTLHRRIKEGAIRPHSNALKPQLTDQNKQMVEVKQSNPFDFVVQAFDWAKNIEALLCTSGFSLTAFISLYKILE